MAIPLAAGKHHLRVSYRPTMYVVGKWISIAATLSYLGGGGAALLILRRKSWPSLSRS